MNELPYDAGGDKVLEAIEDARDLITLYRDDMGDWFAVIRTNAREQGFMYTEITWTLRDDADEGVVAWAEAAHATSAEVAGR